MPQEKFREPMTRTQEVGPNILPAAEEVPCGFFLLARDMNRRERAGAIEHGELHGVSSIRLNAIARSPRNQSGGDDLARHSSQRERPLQLKAARSRFITALDGACLA